MKRIMRALILCDSKSGVRGLGDYACVGGRAMAEDGMQETTQWSMLLYCTRTSTKTTLGCWVCFAFCNQSCEDDGGRAKDLV